MFGMRTPVRIPALAKTLSPSLKPVNVAVMFQAMETLAPLRKSFQGLQ